MAVTERESLHQKMQGGERTIGRQDLAILLCSDAFAERIRELYRKGNKGTNKVEPSFTLGFLENDEVYISPLYMPADRHYWPPGSESHTKALTVICRGNQNPGQRLVPDVKDLHHLHSAPFVAIFQTDGTDSEMLILGRNPEAEEIDYEAVSSYLQENDSYPDLAAHLNGAGIQHALLKFPNNFFHLLSYQATYDLATLLPAPAITHSAEVDPGSNYRHIVVNLDVMGYMFRHPKLVKALHSIMIPSSETGTDTHLTVHIDEVPDKHYKINPGVVRSGSKRKSNDMFYGGITEPSKVFGTLARIHYVSNTQTGPKRTNWPPILDADDLSDIFNTGAYLVMRSAQDGNSPNNKYEFVLYPGQYRPAAEINSILRVYSSLRTRKAKMEFLQRLGIGYYRYTATVPNDSKSFKLEPSGGPDVSPTNLTFRVNLHATHR